MGLLSTTKIWNDHFWLYRKKSKYTIPCNITECNGYDDYFIAKLLGRTRPIIHGNKGKFSSTLLCCCHSQYVRTPYLSIVIAVALFFYTGKNALL